MTKLAHNKCTNCAHEWKDLPGAWAQNVSLVGYDMEGKEKWEAVCPKCKSYYWKWVNYGK